MTFFENEFDDSFTKASDMPTIQVITTVLFSTFSAANGTVVTNTPTPVNSVDSYVVEGLRSGAIRVLTPLEAANWQATRNTTNLSNGAIDTQQAANKAVFELISQATGQIAPIIVRQPKSVSIEVGRPIALSVLVANTDNVTYQWLKDTKELDNAINSVLSIAGVTANDSGVYTVVITNAFGVTTSQNATITIT